MKTYHILNGDALLAQFPSAIPGEKLVVRECLIEGPLQAASPEAFFQQRAAFLQETYDPEGTYFDQTVPDLQQLLHLPAGAELHLWFEDDLFCQTNFWFVASLLEAADFGGALFLVRPVEDSRYGFGGMDTAALEKAWADREAIGLAPFTDLWRAYQSGDDARLRQLAEEQAARYPFLLPAVQAQLDRRPQGALPGRPERSLQAIMATTDRPGFGPVFQAFCQQESIYGFGDLQVKRMYDALLDQA